MKKYGILVVSIGTTCEDAEEKSIVALEKKDIGKVSGQAGISCIF